LKRLGGIVSNFFLLPAVLLSLTVWPITAGAAEFTLGGRVEFYVTWDSTQVSNTLSSFILRNNDPNFQHGRLKMSAERARLFFQMKGPQVWGAKTDGLIEFDWDSGSDVNTTPAGLPYSPHRPAPRLRLAFFRVIWPDTELLMGHYWSLLSEEMPETADPRAALALAGLPHVREPQIRLSQKFGPWTVGLALCEPGNGNQGSTLDPSQTAANNNYPAESSETPKVSGRIKYEQDLWGKAPYWGVPRCFSARLASAWQRSRYRSFNANNARTWGENDYQGLTVRQRDQQYLNQWIVEGSLFIPVLPTHNQVLAGTASLLTQWFVGAGVDNFALDQPANSSLLRWQGFDSGLGQNVYDRELVRRFGGFVQAQYWFTNHWFLNAVWAMSRAFGVDRERNLSAPGGYGFATINNSSDPVKLNQNYKLTLYYQPIMALKFGVEYAYIRADYFQRRNTSGNQNALTNVNQTADVGENHRLMFWSCFFF